MGRSTRIWTLFCLFLLFVGVWNSRSTVVAHPLGNYSINQYFLLDLRSGENLTLYYLLDLAEIPSFAELDLIDTDFDSSVSMKEREAYLDLKAQEILAGVSFFLSEEFIPLQVRERKLALTEGAASMTVINVLLRLEPDNGISLPSRKALDLEIISINYAESVGVRECKVLTGGLFVDETLSLGKDVVEYQTRVQLDQGVNPVYQDFDAQFRLKLIPSTQQPENRVTDSLGFGWTATARTARDSGDQIMSLAFSEVYEDLLTVSSEKTYTSVRRESSGLQAGDSDAPLASLEMKAAARAPGPQNSQDPGADNWMGRIGDVIRSERTTPIMFITGLAFAFLLGALHARSPGHGKTVMAAYLVGERGTVGNACLLGLIVTITHTWSVLLLGVVTLYVREHISEEVFSFWLGIISGIIIVVIGMILFLKRYAAYVLARSQAVKKTGESATASHEGRHDHHHGVRKGDGDPLSYWSILGLGISGGIVPCPSALIVLLLAIRLGRLGYGLWLILAFSAGLAVVLIAIGIIAVKASHLIQKYAGGSGTLRLLSVVSSALIVALGFWIVVWTLFQHRVVILFPGG